MEHSGVNLTGVSVHSKWFSYLGVHQKSPHLLRSQVPGLGPKAAKLGVWEGRPESDSLMSPQGIFMLMVLKTQVKEH